MSERGHPGREVPTGFSRRELLRRTILLSSAAAAAVAVGPLEALASTAGRRSGIPPLEAPGHVTGLVRSGDRLVATVLSAEGAQVWTHRSGADAWAASADASAFPVGTELFSVAALGSTLVAVGHLRELVSTTVYTDEDGHLRSQSAFSGRPVAFTSADGSAWTQVGVDGDGFALGVLTKVVVDGSGTLLAVGGRYPDPDVFEPTGLVSLTSRDGSAWQQAPLAGVGAPDHGDVSLLTQVGGQTLLATTGFQSTGLYVSSGEGWSRIAAPVDGDRVVYLAAGMQGSRMLLAGVDDLDEPHWWLLDGGSRWREVSPPAPVRGDAKVSTLLREGATLVAAGSAAGRGFTTETEGRS